MRPIVAPREMRIVAATPCASRKEEYVSGMRPEEDPAATALSSEEEDDLLASIRLAKPAQRMAHCERKTALSASCW